MLKINLTLFIYCAVLAVPLQAQTIIDYIPNNTPDSRYTLHNDGTVTDSWTGLMWQRCSLGQTWNGSTCTGSVRIYDWQLALQEGEGNSFAGYSDWRLPNRKELRSIVAYDRYNPAINTTVFPNTPSSWYWSSSPDAYTSPDYAGISGLVNFRHGYGGSIGRYYGHEVRLVRSGQ